MSIRPPVDDWAPDKACDGERLLNGERENERRNTVVNRGIKIYAAQAYGLRGRPASPQGWSLQRRCFRRKSGHIVPFLSMGQMTAKMQAATANGRISAAPLEVGSRRVGS